MLSLQMHRQVVYVGREQMSVLLGCCNTVITYAANESKLL